MENKLGEFEGTVKALRRKNTRKDRKIEALTTENKQRRVEAIQSRKRELSFLEMRVEQARHMVFGLHTQITEMKEILARMPDREVWALIIDARWGRTDPLMAQMSILLSP